DHLLSARGNLSPARAHSAHLQARGGSFMRYVSALGLVCLFGAGCTHMQLQKNTLGQFQTVSALHQKQVLDNLAMFIHDPGALPYFNVLSTSLNEVDDTASAMGVLTFARVGMPNLFMVSQDATTVGGSRGFK